MFCEWVCKTGRGGGWLLNMFFICFSIWEIISCSIVHCRCAQMSDFSLIVLLCSLVIDICKVSSCHCLMCFGLHLYLNPPCLLLLNWPFIFFGVFFTFFSFLMQGGLSTWAISPEERNKHDQKFDTLSPSMGYVSGPHCTHYQNIITLSNITSFTCWRNAW